MGAILLFTHPGSVLVCNMVRVRDCSPMQGFVWSSAGVCVVKCRALWSSAWVCVHHILSYLRASGQVGGLCSQVQGLVWSSAWVCVHRILSYFWASGQVGGFVLFFQLS
jgi:hypothetical protein